ncbi:MAG TPA: VapC toxin family PIN domain ribonuclease [Pseudanabaena sp.]|uniref:type II toxin-antitoxin system VapC family toxin n=1 Tax=Pseudanabaena minima TaxID=890415 RepID=UPI000E9CC834|nr:VapC toxin family PIN domain ribonuclease [Pseudanabaena sp.]
MIIADTGFWLALADQQDTHHQAARQKLREIDEQLITTWCVVTETCYLLLKRKGVLAQSKFMESLANGAFETFNLQPDHAQKIAQLMQKYANLPMDLADASLVILAEELGHGRILSVDYRDFNTYRWKNTQPFQNLLQ